MRCWQIVVVLGGCVVNGKPYGPGASSPSGAGPQPSASGQPAASGEPAAATQPSGAPASDDRSDLYTPDGRVREDARYYKEPPYLSAPADPWAAVQGDYPLRWTEEQANHWTVRANESPCTAAQDHCLVKDTWFMVRQSDLDRHAEHPAAQVGAAVAVFGPTGPARPWNARSNVHGDNLIAYRTVPATKKNLVPGVLVIGLSDKYKSLPTSGVGAVEAFWVYGVLESVDYDAGTYKLKDYADPMPLSAARVPVLEWRENTKVKIIGGKKRDELAVSASDVFLPKPAK